MIPFAIVVMLLAWRFPRTAVGVGVVSVLITSAPATRAGCEQLAPSILSNSQEGFFIELPNNSYTHEMGFPLQVPFTNTFNEDLFTLTFGAIPKGAFVNLTSKVLKDTDNEDPDLVKQDEETRETGKIFASAEPELIFS